MNWHVQKQPFEIIQLGPSIIVLKHFSRIVNFLRQFLFGMIMIFSAAAEFSR
jgi:hypothetical protein